jgi:hypothetical protein
MKRKALSESADQELYVFGSRYLQLHVDSSLPSLSPGAVVCKNHLIVTISESANEQIKIHTFPSVQGTRLMPAEEENHLGLGWLGH